MRKIISQLAGILLTAFTFSSVQATTLFQLAGSADVEAVDEAASFPLTIDGITATLTANIGVLNTTAVSGFGVKRQEQATKPVRLTMPWEPSQSV